MTIKLLNGLIESSGTPEDLAEYTAILICYLKQVSDNEEAEMLRDELNRMWDKRFEKHDEKKQSGTKDVAEGGVEG